MQLPEKRTAEVVTQKTIVVGLMLVVVNAYWVGVASELWYAVYTLVSPFSNAIFTLTVLITVNVFLSRFASSLAFTAGELLLIYIMVTMVSTISGHAMMAILMGTLAHPYWFATPENEWAQLFWQHIPSWITVSDTEWLRGYYEGESTIFTSEHLRAWLVPVLVWSGFIFVLYGSLLCIGLVLRKQWMEHEKLSFPLTHLPVQMTNNRSFFRNKLMWIGFSVSAIIRVVNGIHDIFPAMPGFPPNLRLDQYFSDRPWSAIGHTSMSFNLAIVGLTYFMPLDLAFSTWFFFWLTRAEKVFADIIGWHNMHLNDRATGAWIGIALITLWGARRHLVTLIGNIFVRDAIDDNSEPVSYRTTLILTVLSVGLVFLFCYMAGMSFWVIGVFLRNFSCFCSCHWSCMSRTWTTLS